MSLAVTGLLHRPPPTAQEVKKAELERVASQLEGVFMRQLLKSMRETVPASSLGGDGPSNASSTYLQMFDDAIADEASRGEGLGLRKVLLEQLGGAALARTPASAAAALRRVAAMGNTTPAAAGAALAATSPGSELGGVAFEAPNRPEPVRLRDADGPLASPVAGPSRLDEGGLVVTRPGEEVLAAGAGQVVAAGGGALVIDHGGGLRSRYEGLGRVLAQPGDLVLRGQAVGAASNAGRFRFASERGAPAR